MARFLICGPHYNPHKNQDKDKNNFQESNKRFTLDITKKKANG